MALLSVIRRWHLREGVSIREIVRRTKLSRNTIRKYLANGTLEPVYPKRRSPSQLDPYAEMLSSWLVRESTRSRKQRRNLRQLVETLSAGVPSSVMVSEENAASLWANRRRFFFKPVWGFGSKGAYRGSKLTRRTWQVVLDSKYVAQRLVQPSERLLIVDGDQRVLKLDVRCYVYNGEVQLLGARMYRGQTTNFRTEGGGLAAVFAAPTISRSGVSRAVCSLG